MSRCIAAESTSSPPPIRGKISWRKSSPTRLRELCRRASFSPMRLRCFWAARKCGPTTMDAAMQQLDFDTVIPGHGAVTNKAGLQAYRDNIVKLRDRVTQQIHSGKNQTELAKFMETEYQWAPNSLQQQWSVPGFMT